MPKVPSPQLLRCPNRCQWQMRMKSLHEEATGVWRLGTQCVVCLTEVERTVPLPPDEAERLGVIEGLRELMRSHRQMAASG